MVWQIGRERLASEALSNYCALAHRGLITHHFGPSLLGEKVHSGLTGNLCERLMRVFLPREGTNDDLSQAKMIWDTLYQAAYGETKEHDLMLATQ